MQINISYLQLDLRRAFVYVAIPWVGELFVELRKPSPDVPRLVSFDRA